jgi:alkanesulfonate monooxygenase SsuD/methylene tetrahydromethanopterin reductase-like flavin-dependent oxidoreductase (luciferase family)
MYQKGCEAAGRPADGNDWRVARNIFISEDAAEAREHVGDREAPSYFYFNYISSLLREAGFFQIIKPDPDMDDDAVTTEAIVEDVVIAGTPDSVLDQLVAFREEVGPFGTLILVAVDWGGAYGARERRSMELLAENVMPRFAAATGTKTAAQ